MSGEMSHQGKDPLGKRPILSGKRPVGEMSWHDMIQYTKYIVLVGRKVIKRLCNDLYRAVLYQLGTEWLYTEPLPSFQHT